MKKYKLICKKGEGTFSEVVKAENVENGKEYAIKCMKSTFDSLQQVNSLREIQALKRLSPHPNIIHLEEVLFDQPSGRLAMVFELMDANLYDLISGRRDHLDQDLVLSLGYQMFTALEYMHENGIFHRDIKPENILVDPSGKNLKLADLGSCRSINSAPPMTEYIATRWYRSPECLLTDGHYGVEMDIWGAGCVLFEVIALFPLFPGADEVDQINRIHKVVGSPEADVLERLKSKGSSKINYNFSSMKGIGIKHFIPHVTPPCVDLLSKTLIYDHTKRIKAVDAVNHAYFSTVRKSDTSNRLQKSKLGIRKNARVGSDKTNASSLASSKKQSSDKKLSHSKLENKNSSDTNSTKSKIKSNSKPARLNNIKTTLKNNNNNKAVVKSKKPSEKESNIKDISGAARRRRVEAEKAAKLQKKNANLQKKKTTEFKKPVDTKPMARRKKNKFSNVQSSGYGRANTKPSLSQSRLTKKHASESRLNSKTTKQTKAARSRIRKTGDQYDSAGTGATAEITLPSLRNSNVQQRVTRLQRNKQFLKQAAAEENNEQKILPAIKT